jgi:O-antigen/teichoic acid export membrane protein
MKVASIWRNLQKRSVFGANAALTGITNIGLAMLGVTTGVLAARLLGPRGRGELAAIQTWAMLIGMRALLGTEHALVYFSAREPRHSGRFAGTAATISLLAAVPFTIVAYLTMPLLLSAQSPAIVTSARYYLLIVPVFELNALGYAALRGRGDFVPWNAMRFAPTLAWLLILVVAWMRAYSDPRFLAGAYLVALALLLIPAAAVVRRRVVGNFWPDRRRFKPMLIYGLQCTVGGLPILLNLRMDQMLMAAFMPPVDLGLYVAAVAWSGAISPLLNAVASVLFPEVASKESGPEQTGAFARGTRFAALIAAPIGLALTLITPWAMIMLFGAKFRPAIPSALVLVPAGAILGVNLAMEDGMRGLGRPDLVMRAELTGLIVTAGCLALLLRPLGILGAAIASLLGYGTVAGSLLFQARRVTGASTADLLVSSPREIRGYVDHVLILARQIGKMSDA